MSEASREGTLGLRLNIWRKHLKLKQTEFADMTHAHVGMIRKYEGNVSVPGGEILVEFAKTGLDVHWLLTGEGDMCREKAPSDPDESIMLMLNGLDEEKKESLLREFRSRIQDAKQLVELAAVVKSLGRTNGDEQGEQSTGQPD